MRLSLCPVAVDYRVGHNVRIVCVCARDGDCLSFEVDVTVSRCPKCNTRIKPVSKDKVVNKIPQKTSSYYNEFWICPNCEQIYWQGAHWERIGKTLRNAKQALEKLDKI